MTKSHFTGEDFDDADHITNIRARKPSRAPVETCKFCGFRVEDPCDTPPPDVCETAVSYKTIR